MRRRFLFAAIVPLLLLWLTAPALVGGRHYFLRDVLTFTWPEKLWTQAAFRAGDLPLWDPRLGGGVPHLAYVTHGVLDPLNVLLLPFALPRALDLIIVAHLLLAAGTSWWLARVAGLTPLAATIVAAGYSLGGALQGLTTNLPYLASAAWLPLALAALERQARAPGARSTALFALALAAVFVSGDPELAYLVLLLAPLRLLLEGRPAAPRRFAFAALAVALFAALVAVVLLPAMTLLAASERSAGVPLAEAQYWSLAPLRLGELVVPLPFDAPAPDGRWWGHFLENYPSHEPWVASLYQGNVALLLGVLGVLALVAPGADTGTIRSGRFLGLAGVVGVALALGAHTPLYAALHAALPGFDRFRYPAKAFLLASLALAILGGIGLDRVSGWSGRRRVVGLGALGLAVSLALAGAVASGLPRALVERAAASGAHFPAGSPEIASTQLAARGLEAAVTLAGAGALVLALRRRPEWLAPALLALALVDVARIAHTLQAWAGDALFRSRPPVARTLARELTDPRDQRIAFLPEFTDFAVPLAPGLPESSGSGARAPSGLETARLADLANLSPNLAAAWGLRTQGGFLPARPREPFEWWRRALRGGDPLLAMRALSVTGTALVVAAPAAAPGLGQLATLERVAEPEGFARDAALYRVRDAQPRARVVSRATAVADSGMALEELARPGFDAASTVVIEGDGAADPGAATPARTARIERDSGDELEVALEPGATGGWLVVADTWDPGWTAWVDGRSAPVLRAYGRVRAVPVPAAARRVVLRYRPAAYRLGLAASLTALVACLALLVLGKSARA